MDELLTINDELTNAFTSLESFKEYYSTSLANKKPEIWGVELERKLDKIHSYLKGAFFQKVGRDTVLLWFNNVDNLKVGINAISHRVNMDLMEHEAYKDLPEALFHEEIINKDMQETGKTYKELEPVYLKIIQDGINSLNSIKPYSDMGLAVVSKSFREMKAVFKPFIKEENANKKNNAGVKKKIAGSIKESSEFKSFGFSNNSESVLKRIYGGLILETGDFIDKSKTAQDVFVAILTTKDIILVNGEIHFGCETTQVVYIIEKMQEYSRDFTFAKIDSSERFYSKNNKLIRQSNLSKLKSKCPKPKEHDTINKFFANLTLKQ